MTHCGWSNYETWAVNLWLGNDAESEQHWRERARLAFAEAPESRQVKDWNFTPAVAARIRLAEELRDAVRGASPLQEPTLYADLLAASLGEVDWYEIATDWLADLTADSHEPGGDGVGEAYD